MSIGVVILTALVCMVVVAGVSALLQIFSKLFGFLVDFIAFIIERNAQKRARRQ